MQVLPHSFWQNSLTNVHLKQKGKEKRGKVCGVDAAWTLDDVEIFP